MPLLGCLLFLVSATADSEIGRFALANGITVTAVHAAQAPKQVVFTTLPLGLLLDGPGESQFSHLLEHMMIRSTDPVGLEVDGVTFNGETMNTSLRLETFCAPERIADALDRHVRWLATRHVDQRTLEQEKELIALEETNTVAGGYTHKWGPGSVGADHPLESETCCRPRRCRRSECHPGRAVPSRAHPRG